MGRLVTLKDLGTAAAGGGLEGPTGPIGPTGSPGPTGPAGAVVGGIIAFAYIPGPLYPMIGTKKQYCFKTTLASSVLVSTASPSQGADIVVRLNQNGIALATFTLPAGQTYKRFVGNSISLEVDSFITLDIVSVGSTFPGTDLTFQLIV